MFIIASELHCGSQAQRTELLGRRWRFDSKVEGAMAYAGRSQANNARTCRALAERLLGYRHPPAARPRGQLVLHEPDPA